MTIEEKVATCRVCGCTDMRACSGGCFWAKVDRKRGVGVCSRCDEKRRKAKKG